MVKEVHTETSSLRTVKIMPTVDSSKDDSILFSYIPVSLLSTPPTITTTDRPYGDIVNQANTDILYNALWDAGNPQRECWENPLNALLKIRHIFGEFLQNMPLWWLLSVEYKGLNFVCTKASYRANFIYLLYVQNIKFEDIKEIWDLSGPLLSPRFLNCFFHWLATQKKH